VFTVLLLAGGVWLLLALLVLCLCRAAARADEGRTSRHVMQGATVGLVLVASTAAAPPARAEAAQCRGGGVEFEVAPERARDALLCELNHARKRHDAGRLRTQAALAQAAQRHASDMRRRRYFAHESPGGQDVGDRLRRAGYARAGCAWSAGEILAWGAGPRSTPAALVDAWLDSPPHRRVLLSDRYGRVGLGLRGGTPAGGGGVTAAAVLGSRSC
jgi:uncharacterized protein YkwD